MKKKDRETAPVEDIATRCASPHVSFGICVT